MIKKTIPAILALAMTFCLASGRKITEGGEPSLKSAGPPVADFYVAGNGDDRWSGKVAEPTAGMSDGPFRTLERARDEARKAKTSGKWNGRGATIVVRGGFYALERTFTLDAQDWGTPEAPAVYEAWRGEKVFLSGGPALPPGAFKPVTDARALARLDPAARGHVLQADLRALGFTDLGVVPTHYQGSPVAPELFFNGQRMTVARWPKDGWATISKIIEPGVGPGREELATGCGVFEYSGDRPARWNVKTGVWLQGYWCFDWCDEVIQVKAIDPEKRRITLAAPARYGVKDGNPSPRRFYALNLLEELGRPGEYYMDRATGLLYFWPPAPPAGARIVLSRLNAAVVAIRDASDVILRGFTVEDSLENAIEITGGSGVRIQACEVRNVREVGVWVTGGTRHKVEGCDIHDTGTGGIILSGGDRRTLTPAGHEAVNNHIWRFSALRQTYSNAVLLQGVGNRAAHNLIHDAPHEAIAMDGNDHVFEYNVVHDVCTETDDCGGLYKGRNPSCRGNLIRYNFWHHIGTPMGHGNAAVYFDDGDGGDTVFGNVFFHCGQPGRAAFGAVFSHGGFDILAANNIFVECKCALGSAPWDDERWKEKLAGGKNGYYQDKLLGQVDITKPPYTTRYPELIGFLDLKPGRVRVNRASSNVFVNCGTVSNGNWQVPPEGNWVTGADPGFVNAAKGDFRLKPDSQIFSKLPEFKTIPFEKIGLIPDALRPDPFPEPWPCGADKP